MAKLYKTDGTVEPITPANGKTFELDQLKELVGGWIEVVRVRVGEDKILVIDEEGKLKDKPVNEKASELARGFLFAGDCIVGAALLCREQGEDMIALEVE